VGVEVKVKERVLVKVGVEVKAGTMVEV